MHVLIFWPTFCWWSAWSSSLALHMPVSVYWRYQDDCRDEWWLLPGNYHSYCCNEISRMEPQNIYPVYSRLPCSKYMYLVLFFMTIIPTIRQLLTVVALYDYSILISILTITTSASLNIMIIINVTIHWHILAYDLTPSLIVRTKFEGVSFYTFLLWW